MLDAAKCSGVPCAQSGIATSPNCDDGGNGGCTSDTECNDGLYCNGDETCNAGVCEAGSVPCGQGETCDDVNNVCTCTIDEDCDDGAFCNGSETCVGGSCLAGGDPCPDEGCDEASDVCVACAPLGASCAVDSECCGNKCKGPNNGKTCK